VRVPREVLIEMKQVPELTADSGQIDTYPACRK
jgi:hypothetical protein